MYKVLRDGDGENHPKASTSCECHYEGKLIDGTVFDSSYERGSPTSFAPNQVINCAGNQMRCALPRPNRDLHAIDWACSTAARRPFRLRRRVHATHWRFPQVIKGWTEAMQLMVEGDKWEMYIPSELG